MKRELIQLRKRCVRQGFSIRIAICTNQSTEESSQRLFVHVRSSFENTRKFWSKTVTSLGVMMIKLLISRYFTVFLFHKTNPAVMSCMHPTVPFHKGRIIAIFPQWGIFLEKSCHSIKGSADLKTSCINHWNIYRCFPPVS